LPVDAKAERTRGPDGIEALETPDRLVLCKRTYRSLDWGVIMLGFFVGLLVFLMLAIAVERGTLFSYSWWVEILVYGGGVCIVWYCLTRAFNTRTVTLTGQRLTARDGPVPSLARRLDLPVDDIAAFNAYGTKHMTAQLTSYRWHHVDAEMRDGRRMPVFRKLGTEEAAAFAAARIESFLQRARQA